MASGERLNFDHPYLFTAFRYTTVQKDIKIPDVFIHYVVNFTTSAGVNVLTKA